jgi:Spy/CpxP family protein refolding chaperone
VALTRLIVVVGFLTAFVAGLMLGAMFRPLPSVAQPLPPATRPDRESWLAQQLDLSPDQQQQMKQIWSDVSRRGRGPGDKRWQFRRERDEAIKALVPEGQKAAYDRIHADYEAKVDADEKENRAQFDRAVERTKALLTPDQQKKYEEILGRQGAGDRDRGRPSTRPTR